MLRRLHHEQPASFAFTPANQAWAEAQITKYPEGRQASAIIPLLWRAQEQEGWLTRPAIEGIADMLGMAYMRAVEVASFYFMFQLHPVGSVANIQVCGTTSCMICGAEDLVAVCREKIADKPHTLSQDGKFSWEEVECLGACANAPMAQIGKDYYEDLTAERLGEIIDELASGKVPTPGPQQGRFASEPASGLTSLKDFDSGQKAHNASVQLATDLGETIKRIDGTEVPLLAPWRDRGAMHQPAKPNVKVLDAPLDIVKETGRIDTEKAAKGDAASSKGKPDEGTVASAPKSEPSPKTQKTAKTSKATPDAPQVVGETAGAPDDAVSGKKPKVLKAARKEGADDLKRIKGVGPKLEALLNRLGFYHFDQIASWTPEETAWVDENLEGFKGRATRDDWAGQARRLASGD
ncbi:NADH-quinone oxidoreductase subunit E [Roseovarius sp. D0-M9]|uniref:NADH-quinone oxidoreductase subunit E n=1 Tax=Roseovarius sp. D0-M9 TaxID=3127117 RepID=UPI00300FEF1A